MYISQIEKVKRMKLGVNNLRCQRENFDFGDTRIYNFVSTFDKKLQKYSEGKINFDNLNNWFNKNCKKIIKILKKQLEKQEKEFTNE